MTEERMRILEMVRDGKITAEEGARLLEALQPKTSPHSGGAGGVGAGYDQDDPVRSIASTVAQALQSGDWKAFMGQFASSRSTGSLAGLERKQERESDGWQFLNLSDGDKGTFEVQAGDELLVEHEAGSIEATAADGPARLALDGDETHGYGVYVARKDKQVVVACFRTAQYARMPRLKLAVPRDVASVSQRTAGGGLTADGFTVPVKLRTAGGSIRVREQKGASVDAKTSGGSIKVDGTLARIDLHTSGGSVTFDGSTEAFDVKTSGGSVRIEGARLMTGEHIAKTSGGSVRILLARESSVELEVKTSAGSLSVELPGAEGERTGSRVSPKYHGRYNGGAAKLSVSTAAGQVSVGLKGEEAAKAA